MNDLEKINVGIGFATGRKNFKQILRTYTHNWREAGLTENSTYNLNLLVAYDLKYFKTKTTDFTSVSSKINGAIQNSFFIGTKNVNNEISYLTEKNIIDKKEALLLFRKGYAGKRNTVLYFAIKNRIDYLIFLDDDEYPLAVTRTKGTCIWSGQHVLLTHLNYITGADITHGHHCGYISPIPHLEFNDVLSETDFRVFIEAISNDILNWNKIKTVMQNGGVTYADKNVLMTDEVKEVPEINNAKFISGANLCFNLNNPDKVKPFYNPPNARGEDTFLSTLLTDHKVIRVPCYTFHDGFSAYNHLLEGVLPINLKQIDADSDFIINRFYRACIGWTRYKPLLLYITQRDKYEATIKAMHEKLEYVLPKICEYFNNKDFMNVLAELTYYSSHVTKHYNEFIEAQHAWSKIMSYLMIERSKSV